MRVFISIDIPKEIQEKIKKIQDSLPEFIGKKTEIENLHLTLKFLGEVNEETLKKIKKKLEGIKVERFEAGIDSIGVFSEDFIRIVWLHLYGVDELQKEVDKALDGLFEAEKRFMSHLTIARVKKINNKKEFLAKLRKIRVEKIGFSVENFKLKKSTLTDEGPVYGDLVVYNLIK